MDQRNPEFPIGLNRAIGLKQCQSARPQGRRQAIPSRAMSWLPKRPVCSRVAVTGLSAITCDLSRDPFLGLGSMVTRKSEASASSEVSWQTAGIPAIEWNG